MKKTIALPNAGGGTVYSAGVELGVLTARGASETASEFVVTAPALTVVMLPDGETCKYSIQRATDAAFSSPEMFAADVLVQTGAGAAGAAAASARIGVPTNHLAFYRLRIVLSPGAANSSAVTGKLETDVRTSRGSIA